VHKRLIILADPYNAVAQAPRLRFLCDYLTQRGWQLVVYTEQLAPLTFSHSYPIHEIPFYRNRLDWLLKAGWSLLTDWKDRYFTRQVSRAIQEQTFDAVFCTTFSTFPLGTALTIAHQRHLPLHVDIRDLDEQVPGAQYQGHRGWWTLPFRRWYKTANIRRRNHVLRAADSITTISPWHVDFIRRFNPNVHLVFNGYDPSRFYPKNVLSESFLVSYIGKIYEFQDLTSVEEAIRRLNNPEIVLNLHTPSHATLPLEAVPDEIRRSSIMVVLTNPDAKGMMTTKFYEALGCEKPVLCVPDDQGLLSETIRRTNAGIATDDVDVIMAFIREKYAEWKQNGFTRQPVNQKAKEAFSRAVQAQQIEELIAQQIPPKSPIRLSIIIPVYNAEPYLRRCLDSVLRQQFRDFEVIAVNDGSTDASLDILRQYAAKDTRIQVFNQTNRGQSAARNVAFKQARGEWLFFLDSDDYWADNYLEQILPDLTDETDVLQTGYTWLPLGGPAREHPCRRKYRFLADCLKIVRREFLRKNDIIFPENLYYDDPVWSARLWQAHPRIVLSTSTGYYYCQNRSSITANPHSTKPVRRELRQMGLRLWSFGWLRLRLAAHFLKERIINNTRI